MFIFNNLIAFNIGGTQMAKTTKPKVEFTLYPKIENGEDHWYHNELSLGILKKKYLMKMRLPLSSLSVELQVFSPQKNFAILLLR